MLRVLNLPQNVIKKIKNNEISFGHAKILVSLPAEKIEEAVKEIEEKNLSVRETEKLVKKLKKTSKEDEDFSEELVEVGYKFKKLGLKIELGKDFVKLKVKNETDLEKLKKLLENIN
jgi:ParB family chromosome partitioning protein